MRRCILLMSVIGCFLTACERESRSPTQFNADESLSRQDSSSKPHGHPFRAYHPDDYTVRTFGAAQPAYYGSPSISYHGGIIIPSEKVAAIYWSTRTIYRGGPAPGTTGAGSTDGSLIGSFLNHLAGSSYYAINTLYSDTFFYIQNNLTYSQFWASNSGAPAAGSNVSLSAIQAKIAAGLNSGALTYDGSTVYLVFTDTTVDQDNLYPRNACAEHGYFSWNGKNVLYGAMPHVVDEIGCRQWDALPGAGSPNNDPAADAEMNLIAHEVEETNSNPFGASWYDDAGNETADKCRWLFDATYTTANGAKANMNVGGKDFLIQQNWQLAYVQGCEARLFTATISGPYQAQPSTLCYWTQNTPVGGRAPYTYAWLGNSNAKSSRLGFVTLSSGFVMFDNVTDVNGVTIQPAEYVDVRQYYPRCGS